MPSKKKSLFGPKPKGKAKAQDPQTENGFLEAADDFEQAAGKWRAGDAAKATRFFNRAIDTYTEGLKRYPQSFDLAYNKCATLNTFLKSHLLTSIRANLEYNITEDERIVSQLGSRTALLEETLKSHRFAMTLNSSNHDILFNAGQVLTSLAEVQLQVGTQAAGKYEARPLLEEAVDLFTRCLESQQQEYTQMQAEIAKAQASGEYTEAWEGERQQPTNAEEDSMDTTPSVSEGAGDWAIIEEVLTPEVILETCTAQLGALTALLGIYNPTIDLHHIEKKAQDGLKTASTRIQDLIGVIEKSQPSQIKDEPAGGPTLSIGSAAAEEEASTSPKDDAVLAAANFQAGIAEVTYRSGRSTSTEYAQVVEQTFSSLVNKAEEDGCHVLASVNVQSAFSDALMDIASALADGPEYNPSSPTFSTDIIIQWTALTQAQTLLTGLSSPPQSSLLPPARLADVFMARGDIDLFRYRISLFSEAKQAWTKSGPVLLANSGVFYRGARSYAERAGTVDVRNIADTKATIAEVLKDAASEAEVKRASWSGKSDVVSVVLEQMLEEGIIGLDNSDIVLVAAK